uniref:Uncharacterized protein n=1 Tax=Trypanosoma vivax (strain Y486) TaxID=1055687 RepID=G0U077_TRYVY|nr:hypothetical protein TVY486_0800830 [Trypanosoma vivax Y486]
MVSRNNDGTIIVAITPFPSVNKRRTRSTWPSPVIDVSNLLLDSFHNAFCPCTFRTFFPTILLPLLLPRARSDYYYHYCHYYLDIARTRKRQREHLLGDCCCFSTSRAYVTVKRPR